MSRKLPPHDTCVFLCFFHGFLMKPQTQSTKTKSYVLQLFLFCQPFKKSNEPKQNNQKIKKPKAKKKNWENKIAPPKGGGWRCREASTCPRSTARSLLVAANGSGSPGSGFLVVFWDLRGFYLRLFSWICFEAKKNALYGCWWDCSLLYMCVLDSVGCTSEHVFSSYNP